MKLKKNLPVIIVTLTAGILRLFNIGYSDYQGDEIKALFLPSSDQSAFSFLMDQRKGPMQFIITAALKYIDPTYDNQLLVRLPFALAGTLAVFFFYKLIKHHFGERIAFFSSLFFATNGFFIALSRIVQYQPFVILFMVLTLYAFTHKRYYLAFSFWALSILSHYDGIFIAPFVLYLVYKDLKNNHLWLGAALGGIFLASFYVPFVLSISEATKSYWLGRLEGTGGKISSSRYLFQVYQPIYAIHFYTALAFLGIIQAARVVNLKIAALAAWFLFPFAFLEMLVEIPGTHIYTYLLPLAVLMGFGIELCILIAEKVLNKHGKYLVYAGLIVLFVFLFAQSYMIYVDHSREYPWEDEKFVFWTFAKPSAVYHLSLFGFPYYRHWEEIRDLVESKPNIGFYSCNERSSISRYSVPLQKNAQYAGFYIHILNPQSFRDVIEEERIKDWVKAYNADRTYYDSNGRVISEVYIIPTDFAANQLIDNPQKVQIEQIIDNLDD